MNITNWFDDLEYDKSEIGSQELEFSNTNSLFRLKVDLPEFNPAPENDFENSPAPIGHKEEEEEDVAAETEAENIIDKPLLKENNCSCPQVVENKKVINKLFLTVKGTITSSQFTFAEYLLYSSNTPSMEDRNNIFDTFSPTDSQLILDDELMLEEKTEATKSIGNTPPPSNVKQKFQNNSRKYKPDSIRKKIKSRTLKNIKNIINNKIKKEGGIMFFDYLPQEFVSNVKVRINKEVLDYSFRQLLITDFCGKNKEKLANNIRVLYYLDNNPQIKIKSGVDFLLKCSFKSLCNMFFASPEFKKDITKLISEGEDNEYINKYKYLAFTFVSFFESNGKLY